MYGNNITKNSNVSRKKVREMQEKLSWDDTIFFITIPIRYDTVFIT